MFGDFSSPVITRGGLHVGVSGEFLHRRDVGSGIKQVGDEGAPCVPPGFSLAQEDEERLEKSYDYVADDFDDYQMHQTVYDNAYVRVGWKLLTTLVRLVWNLFRLGVGVVEGDVDSRRNKT